jgi:hypothetical protein
MCPYCARPSMTLFRKLVLGPDATVPCAACGKRVGVPWGAVAAAAPVALGIVAAIELHLPWNIVGASAGVAAYVAIQIWLVPVVGRDA